MKKIITPITDFFKSEIYRWNYISPLGMYEYRYQMITMYSFIIYLIISTALN